MNQKQLISDPFLIYQAFLFGCLSPNLKIQLVCANAVSFLVLHRLVYKTDDGFEDSPSNYGPKSLRKNVNVQKK